MKRAILSAALAVASMAGVFAQDKPNFTGIWQIDPAQSDKFSGGAPTETITVEGSKMTIARTRSGNTSQVVYMLDGTPSMNRYGGAEVPYISKWDGTVLVTTIKMGQGARIEKRSIQSDGTMKNEVTFDYGGARRPETGWMVFNRIK